MSKTPHCCKNRGLNDGNFPIFSLRPLNVLDKQSQWVSLSSADLTAEVNPLGAQLSTLRDRTGRDLLWDGEPSVWTGRAPLLFPIVGTLAGGSYLLGSKI
jgi:galactose mutarotase-like enzyme